MEPAAVSVEAQGANGTWNKWSADIDLHRRRSKSAEEARRAGGARRKQAIENGPEQIVRRPVYAVNMFHKTYSRICGARTYVLLTMDNL
jgi:hypothetical protein